MEANACTGGPGVGWAADADADAAVPGHAGLGDWFRDWFVLTEF